MEKKENLYEPAVNFHEHKSQMLMNTVIHDTLYENAFLGKEDASQTEYAQNTTTWD